MGASIVIYWPGITDEQMDADIGFQNDDRAWANWIVEIDSDKRLQTLLKSLGIDALWSHTTHGMADKDVRWVSPDQLSDAAWSMIRLIESNDARIKPLLAA